MPPKRFLKIASAMGFLLLAVALIRAALEPAVTCQEFEQRMDAYFSESGFEVMFRRTEEAASVPLPFYPHMHSLFVRREHSTAAPTGFTDSVQRWNIARVGGPAFKLLVRYYDGHAVRVVICSYVKYTKERRDLRDALAKMFPHVQITFEDLCPPDWARVVQ